MSNHKPRHSLAEMNPDLCKEWNYEKNGELVPESVSAGSRQKVPTRHGRKCSMSPGGSLSPR